MSNNSTCILSVSYVQAKLDVYFFVFYILTPVYFFVAFFGHILCLVGFVKRAKIEPAYAYQIYIAAAKLMEISCFTIFVVTFKWSSGIESQGVLWYKQNYHLMWYAAHASTPISNSCISTSLFMAVAMTGDRLFALWKPFLYRTVNVKKHQITAVVICVVLGWSTSIFDWFRYSVVPKGDIYVAVVNSVYVGGTTASVLANLRNVLRGAAVFALVFGNVTLIRLFGRHAKVKPTTGGNPSTSTALENRQAKRKSSEKSLLIIVVVQSIFTAIVIFLFVTYYVLSYADPSFIMCSGVMFASVMDGMLEVADIAVFIIVVSVDKKVRMAILTALKLKNENNRKISTMTINKSDMNLNDISTSRRVSTMTIVNSDTDRNENVVVVAMRSVRHLQVTGLACVD